MNELAVPRSPETAREIIMVAMQICTDHDSQDVADMLAKILPKLP